MSEADGQVRFSVVVPAFNEAGFVGAALESLVAQDFGGGFEVIVVDNNSSDATFEVASGFGVRVVREVVPGVCAARQRGLLEARGEIVVSTDADTVHPRDWLSRIDVQFGSSAGVVAVAGPCRYADPSWWAAVYPRVLFGVVGAVFGLVGRVVYVSATNVAFVRAAFSGYDLSLTQGGDEFDLLRRLRCRGRVVWDRENVVVTSPRRLQRGLLYSLFVTLLTYYLLAYLLNRLSSRTVLGMAPAVRQQQRSRPKRPRPKMLVGAAALFLALAYVAVAHYGMPAAFGGLSRLLTRR
jgi:glycosyltransferase involved in cell wall biosynthesis